MGTEIVRSSSSVELAVSDLAQQASDYLHASVAENTKRTYETSLRALERFCQKRQIPFSRGDSVDPIVLCAFVTELAAEVRPSTIATYLAGLRKYHEGFVNTENPLDDYRLKRICEGIRRKKGVAPTPKRAVSIEELRAMVAAASGESFCDVRDRALLLLGWFGAFRRSELTSLVLADVREVEEGLEIAIRRSKTDQEGAGQIVMIPYASEPSLCPVRAFRRYVQSFRPAGPQSPLFCAKRNRAVPMGSGYVWVIVRERARMARLDPSLFGGHSLRSGFATAAARAGKRVEQIQKHLRHATPEMTLRYVQARQRWEDNPATGLV